MPLRDIRDLAGDIPGQRSSSRAPILSPFVILAKAGIHGPLHAFWIPTFVGKTGWGVGMTYWRGGNDILGGQGGQREITRFPIGHVKPCPYGTYETSLVMFPVNGRQAVPLPK